MRLPEPGEAIGRIWVHGWTVDLLMDKTRIEHQDLNLHFGVIVARPDTGHNHL